MAVIQQHEAAQKLLVKIAQYDEEDSWQVERDGLDAEGR